MKIAFIGQKGIPTVMGGVERHVEGLSVELARRGHEVLVYTRPNYTPKDLLEYRGVKLVSLPTVGTKHLDAISHTFLACLDLIFSRRVDIVHFHSIGPSLLVWLVRLFSPRTIIVSTFHCQDYNHQKWNWLARTFLKLGEKLCCSLSHQVITVSEDLKTYADLKYNINTCYLPNGANLEEAQDDANIFKKWGLKKGQYIMTASRLVRHKGIHYAIEAFKALDTDKKLVIVGDGFFTDDYVEELRALAENSENIIFTGVQSGQVLKALYSNAFLVLQPSESEGLSVVLLDAMSFGTAVLASDIRANAEALGDVGFYFKSKNSEDLSRQLRYLLKNQELVAHKAKQGRQRIEKLYSWEKIGAGVEEVYINLLTALKPIPVREDKKPA